MKKGIIGFLLAGGIVGIIVLIIIIAISWYITWRFPILCMLIGSFLDRFGLGGLCGWIQLFIMILILRMIIPIGK